MEAQTQPEGGAAPHHGESSSSVAVTDGKPRMPPRSSHFSTHASSKKQPQQHHRGGHYQPPHRTGKTPMKDALERATETKHEQAPSSTATPTSQGDAATSAPQNEHTKKPFKKRERKPKKPPQEKLKPHPHPHAQASQPSESSTSEPHPNVHKAPMFVLASSQSDPTTAEVRLGGASSSAPSELSAKEKKTLKWKQKKAEFKALKREQQKQHNRGEQMEGKEGGSAPQPKVSKADKFKNKKTSQQQQPKLEQPSLPVDPSHPAFALAPSSVSQSLSPSSSSSEAAPNDSSTGDASRPAKKKERRERKPKKLLDKIAQAQPNGGDADKKKNDNGNANVNNNNTPKGPLNNRQTEAKLMRGKPDDKQKDARRKKERKRFHEYMKEEDVKSELEKGTLVEGVIRINPHNRRLAYVTVDGFERDILIEGPRLRNRAFDGDMVVLRLFPEEVQQDSNKDKEKAEKSKEESKNVQMKLSQDLLVNKHMGAGERDYSSSDEDVEAEDDFDPDAEPKAPVSVEEDDSKQGKRRTGEVVYISQANHPTEFVGYLKPAAGDGKGSLSHNDKHAFLIPLDKKLPRFIVNIKDFPVKKLVQSAEEWNTNLFVCKETPWKISQEYPHAKLTQNLGVSGEMEVELQAIIKGNSIDQSDFPPQVLSSLPSANWKIPDDEYKVRRDMRNDRIFTIDPLTARDMDDAISCIMIDDTIAEVGVHIADVTYFLKEGTKLDEIAKKRATTVYFVEFSIPMLPRVLCDTLCSLNPHEDRLSISVIWKMNIKTAEIIGKPWIGRTVIRSCCKLDYGTAQAMIEGTFDAKSHTLTLDTEHKEHTIEQIMEDVKRLDGIAQIMRKKRFDTGALSLNTVKLCFKFDKEKERSSNVRATQPVSCFVYETRDSNHLIEEFALLANAEVARTIQEAYPNHSLIRIHESPRPDLMEEYIQFCDRLGVKIDYSSSGALHRSIQAAADPNDPHRLQIFQLLATKAFKQAKYICTGVGLANDGGVKKPPTFESFRHYALNEPLYTHFTSPIRRYADVAVHRILLSVLGNSAKPPMEKSIVAEIAKNCNEKKTKATRASEDCDFMYLWSILRTKPAKETGVVIDVNSKSFEVLIPNYGEAMMVYIEDMVEVVTCEYNSEKKQLVLGLSEDYDTGDGSLITQSTTTAAPASSSSTTSPEDSTPASTSSAATPTKRVGRIVNVDIFSKFNVEVRGEFNNKKMQVKLRVLF